VIKDLMVLPVQKEIRDFHLLVLLELKEIQVQLVVHLI
jgi:hypothetical protein